MSLLISTTPNIEGHRILKYLGIVTGEAILGANFVKDFFAKFTDVLGGRSGSYERELHKARKIAFDELELQAKKLGANGVIGVDIDYEVIGLTNGSMLMVSVSGTAVNYEQI
jgi:uncharacterized protein YbjQ (UPF0145 family)